MGKKENDDALVEILKKENERLIGVSTRTLEAYKKEYEAGIRFRQLASDITKQLEEAIRLINEWRKCSTRT